MQTDMLQTHAHNINCTVEPWLSTAVRKTCDF